MIRHVPRRDQTGVGHREHDAIRGERHARLADGHGSVVRAPQAPEDRPHPHGPGSRDGTELPLASPRGHVSEEPAHDAPPQEEPSGATRREHTRHAAPAHGGAEEDDTPGSRQRSLLEEVEDGDPTQAVPHEVHDLRIQALHVRPEAAGVLDRGPGQGGIGVDPGVEAGLAQAVAQDDEIQPRHPDSVHQDDGFRRRHPGIIGP